MVKKKTVMRILVYALVSESTHTHFCDYFSVFWNCCQLERLNERTVRQCFFHETMSCAAYSTSVSNPSSNCAKLMLNSMCRR